MFKVGVILLDGLLGGSRKVGGRKDRKKACLSFEVYGWVND